MSKKDRFPSQELDQYMLRFPDGMRDELKKLAAKNGRSLNAEIIQRLERTITSDELVHEVPDQVSDKYPNLEEREKDILRKKLHEALLDSGIMNLMAEYTFKNRHKDSNE